MGGGLVAGGEPAGHGVARRFCSSPYADPATHQYADAEPNPCAAYLHAAAAHPRAHPAPDGYAATTANGYADACADPYAAPAADAHAHAAASLRVRGDVMDEWP